MECNIAEVGGQIVECSKGKIVIRAPVKDEKNDLIDLNFQLKSNSVWIVSNKLTLCSSTN